MATKIEIRKFTSMPELATEGWDPNALSMPDYESARAKALYEALGVDPSDEEYSLAENVGSKLWALIGITETGHRFAVEVED